MQAKAEGKSFCERASASVGGKWEPVRDVVLALKPCRAAMLLVIGGLLFLLMGQGEDVLRALAERRTSDGFNSQVVWFFVATLGWSLSAWYWSRVMLRLEFPGIPPKPACPDVVRFLREWAPRGIGALAAAGVAWAFYSAAAGYDAGEHGDVRDQLRFYGFWSLLGAGAFLAVSAGRRRILGAAYARTGIALFRPLQIEDEPYGRQTVCDLGPATRRLLLASIAVAVGFFLIFAGWPQWWAPRVGSAAIVLIAAASWIAVGSVLDFAGMRLRAPVFSGLVALAVLFSLWNDNHQLRTIDGGNPEARLSLKDGLNAWLKRHEQDRSPTIPLYLVDAEGGGIRAAYWTVTVLGEIQRRQPAFADHVFSISGVSGGSLGAAVFVALVAESRARKEPLEIKETAQAILGEDFLAPAVAGILYPDLAQRIWPWPATSLDRATILEQAWERAWNRHVPSRARMSEPFDALWSDPKHWTPVLLLNATWVETGKRLIVSNLAVSGDDFVDAEDANAFLRPRSVSLATAAHMSARFTYVSPAGTLVKGTKTYGRVVDGGYFENSGATATREILQTIDQLAGKDRRWRRVKVYVIHISNEPVDPQHASERLLDAPDNPQIAPKRLLNEAASPIRAIFNTREARGSHARKSVEWVTDEDQFLHFGLCRASRNAPLGWVLARSTQERMRDQLVETDPRCGKIFDNRAKLQAIEAHFGAPKRAGQAVK